MDTDNHSSIDFANSKSDSYKALTNEDVISELNAYFKSYIAGVSEEAQQNVSNGLSFDDAMDGINSNREDDNATEAVSKPFDAELSDENDDGTAEVSAQMLDVELLEQHIDKANLSGGNDATRVIENMAGGGLNNRDETDSTVEEFEESMLGGSTIGSTKNAGAMSGYSGVTDEIRVKGKRVTERSRNNIAYRSETGRLDMGMLGGSFEDMAEDDDNNDENQMQEIDPINAAEEEDVKEYEAEDEIDNNDEAETYEQEPTNIASEIDLVLNQLRNKTGRTLTGGSVNIRKKVVLTDMYPYIIRS